MNDMAASVRWSMVACLMALVVAAGSTQPVQAGDAARPSKLKPWLLAAPKRAPSSLDQQKAFSYKQHLKSRSKALEHQFHSARRGKRSIVGKDGRLRAGRPAFAGREVFDPLQNTRSELLRIRRATNR